jgi:uncharacterized repeat protein (TIGR04076 family)
MISLADSEWSKTTPWMNKDSELNFKCGDGRTTVYKNSTLTADVRR